MCVYTASGVIVGNKQHKAKRTMSERSCITMITTVPRFDSDKEEQEVGGVAVGYQQATHAEFALLKPDDPSHT